MSFLAFQLSLIFAIPALVVAGIIILLCISGNRNDRSFVWATLMVIASVILVYFTWHFTWVQLLKYFTMSIGIGLVYTAFKWVREVIVYHRRVIEALDKVKSWPVNLSINTEDLDIGTCYLVNPAKSRKEALKALTPQFSEYKAPALGWTIFWPFFILVDIAPIRLIKTIISSFSRPAQYFADKLFEDKNV